MELQNDTAVCFDTYTYLQGSYSNGGYCLDSFNVSMQSVMQSNYQIPELPRIMSEQIKADKALTSVMCKLRTIINSI